MPFYLESPTLRYSIFRSAPPPAPPCLWCLSVFSIYKALIYTGFSGLVDGVECVRNCAGRGHGQKSNLLLTVYYPILLDLFISRI